MRISKYLSCHRNLLGILSSQHSFRLDNVLKRSYCVMEDQKTTADILNRPGQGPLMINSYSSNGFRLNNGLFVVGPIVIFPSTVISWNVANDDDIGEEALSIFSKIEPKLDIVLIGLSAKANESRGNITRIYKILKSYNINCEILQSDRACPTFNFLNNEGRYVAAALMPPLSVTLSDNDLAMEFRRMKQQMKDDFFFGTDLIDDMAKEIDNKKSPQKKLGSRESMIDQSHALSKHNSKKIEDK